MVYNKAFLCREDPLPELMMTAMKHLSETTVGQTMYVELRLRSFQRSCVQILISDVHVQDWDLRFTSLLERAP